MAATGQNEKAIRLFERSLQIEPNDSITLSQYAGTLTATSQDEEALQFFERSLQQYSGHFLRQRLKPAFHRWYLPQ